MNQLQLRPEQITHKSRLMDYGYDNRDEKSKYTKNWL